MSRLVKVLIFIFLVINLVVRISFLKNEIFVVKFIFFLGIVLCLFIFFFPRYLKILLFLFALSFPLYGWDSFSINNLIFEFFVVILTLSLYFIGLKDDSNFKINRILFQLFFLYISLSCLSIFMLPLRHAIKLFFLWGPYEFSYALASSTPELYLYSITAINRLLLFFVFIFLLSVQAKARELYQILFIGALIGGVGSAILGILNQFGMISLNWYQQWFFKNRLQSVFGNPSWFSEYICIVIPFILIGFLLKSKGKTWKFFLFLVLIICQTAIILTGSRTSWFIYPLILIFCLLFYYLFMDPSKMGIGGNNVSKIVLKVSISIPIIILVSIFIILQIIEKPKPLNNTIADGQHGKFLDDDYHTFINKRFSERKSMKIRYKLWKGGIAIGMEKPIFGMGYESYGRHVKILRDIKESSFYKNYLGFFLNTPHNTFIQIFISGGIIGLILWFSIILYILWMLILRLKREKNLISLAVILSVISFYLYGMFQSMQYISVIWFFHFLCIGYGMTTDISVLTQAQHKFWKIWIKIFAICVLIGGFVYLFSLESKNLAKKYGMEIYAKDKSISQYQGFYPLETGSFGPFRWSGEKGLIQYNGQGIIELKYICHHPDVEKNPVMLLVYSKKEKIDFVTFTSKGEKKRQYFFSNLKKESFDLLFEVSRIWNPRKYGISVDGRNLGIGISPVKAVKGFPGNDVGFYQFENWKRGSEYWSNEKTIKFRWMGIRASMKIKENDKRKGMKLYFLASHPDLSNEKPVVLEIYGNSMKLAEFKVRKSWQEVKLEPEDIKNLDVLTFQVNRTWNPKLFKFSSDDRDLGIAIAKLN